MRPRGEETGRGPAAVGSGEAKLRAVAIAPRLARFHGDFPRPCQAADPSQRLEQDLALGRQLAIVGKVLVLAASALAEHTARRIRPLVGAALPTDRHAVPNAASLGVFDLDLLAGQDERHEYRNLSMTGESGSTVNELLDAEFRAHWFDSPTH